MKRLNNIQLRVIREHGPDPSLTPEDIRILAGELLAARHLAYAVKAFFDHNPHLACEAASVMATLATYRDRRAIKED